MDKFSATQVLTAIAGAQKLNEESVQCMSKDGHRDHGQMV